MQLPQQDKPVWQIKMLDEKLAKQFQQELDTLWGIGYAVNPMSWEQDLDRIRP